MVIIDPVPVHLFHRCKAERGCSLHAFPFISFLPVSLALSLYLRRGPQPSILLLQLNSSIFDMFKSWLPYESQLIFHV